MFEFFFNPITHTISNVFMFSALVYALVLMVLGFFKRKIIIRRILPKFIAENDAFGMFVFLGLLLGVVGIFDITTEYTTPNELFPSVLVLYALVGWITEAVLYVSLSSWYKSIQGS